MGGRGGGGQMVSILGFYSEDRSSNPTEWPDRDWPYSETSISLLCPV